MELVNASTNYHSFHIPVMGIGFTLDTPMKVGPYGISSCISLVDDTLVEQARKRYTSLRGDEYVEIKTRDEDARARRITAYLNLVQKVVDEQTEKIRQSSFADPLGIRRYYELLPETSAMKNVYRKAIVTTDEEERRLLEQELRQAVRPGEIEVNIMTKLDRDTKPNGDPREAGDSDALTALRGFAKSKLQSSVVLSAGMNPRLYQYLSEFKDFLPAPDGSFVKRIVLKVSDYRSAKIQGKYLAKRGIWVSEYRLESGLNCGGHAFPTAGALMGPILEEFRDSRLGLQADLFELYRKSLGDAAPDVAPQVFVTAQGGVGTFDEHQFLRQHYGVDRVGWGSPFLLVPEVTSVDESMLSKLGEATDKEIRLSRGSPLGVRFWMLTTCASEVTRQARVDAGKPGSPCPKGFCSLSQQYSKAPLCPASREFQKQALKEAEGKYEPKVQELVEEAILAPTCICHDLGGTFKIRNQIKETVTPSVCPGPNLVNFDGVRSLDEMVSHIYGRQDIMANDDRSHVFVNELKLYADYVEEQKTLLGTPLSAHKEKALDKMIQNLLTGVEYYRGLAQELGETFGEGFLPGLEQQAERLVAAQA